MDFTNQYKEYVSLDGFGETYEVTLPSVSVHNLIIGTMYTDLGGSSSIRLMNNPNLECNIKYTKRGWLSKDTFKVEGEVIEYQDKDHKKSKIHYKIHGNWNKKVYIT